MLSNNKPHSPLPFIIAVYVTALILRPILAVKIITIFSINFPAGILVFPLSFICNDIFTEVYGFNLSKRIIQAGLIAQVLSMTVISIAIYSPAAIFWNNQTAYETILGQTPRLAIASLIGCYFGEIVNSIVMSKMKFRSGSNLELQMQYRFVVSTLFGELIDSLLYIGIGFLGVYSFHNVVMLILTTWLGKTVYEVLLLPVSTAVCRYVKESEGIDTVDEPAVTEYGVI